MTDLEAKDTVCVVVITTPGRHWIFGIYDSEVTAKKRVKELGYEIPDDALVEYFTDLVWTEKVVSE